MLTLVETLLLLVATIGLARTLFAPQSHHRYRWLVHFSAITTCLTLAAWCSGTDFAETPGRIVSSSVAVVPFTLVALWTVAFRESTTLRMAAFIVFLVVLTLLLGEPVTDDLARSSVESTWLGLRDLDRLRLAIGICGGLIAGVYCRLLGWRIQPLDQSQGNGPSASTRDLWILIGGIGLSVPLLLVLQLAAQQSFSRIFDSNFAMLRMSCFYAACVLAFLSIMVCRFSNQWLVAAIVIIGALSVQYVWREDVYRYQRFLLKPEYWYQFTPIFILTWWTVTLVLRGFDISFRRTGELLLFQVQIKHFIVATGLACFLLSSVRTKLVEQLPATVKRDVQQVGGDVTLRGNEIVGITIMRDGVPDILLKTLPRLRHLESVVIVSSSPGQELISLLSKCPRLKSLEIRDSFPVIAGAPGYSGFEQLERLVLTRVPVSAAEFGQLTSGSSIRHLCIDEPQLLKHLGKATSESLRILEFQNDPNVASSIDSNQLLTLETPQLEAIQWGPVGSPRPTSFGLIPFTDIPKNFPKLRKFSYRCSRLTPDVLRQLNRLPLEELGLLNMESGFDLLGDLDVPRVMIGSKFEDATFDRLLNDPKVVGLSGKLSHRLMQDRLHKILRANADRDVSFDLSAVVPPDDAANRQAKKLPQPLAQGEISNEMLGVGGGQISRARAKQFSVWGNALRRTSVATDTESKLTIQPGKQLVVARGFRLQLEQFVSLCEDAGAIRIDSPVYDNDELILHNYYSENPHAMIRQLHNLTDERWERLRNVIKAGHLVMEDPDVTIRTWKGLAEWSGTLQINWSKLPEDYVQTVDALAELRVVFSVEDRIAPKQLDVFKRNDSHLINQSN